MSQPLLKDPIVVSGPTRTGTGTGTVSVDKLTHFTTAQTYTLVCIAKSPDTLFSVSASLDGPVGIATVGMQFFDADLKIFLTIQQGGTAFEVGDTFVLTLQNGTDLDQANIDLFDELPQKNFGPGIKGTLAGDHSVRYHDDAISAYAFLQGLKFLAVTPGANGNNLQVQTAAPVAPIDATGGLESITFDAVTPGAAGNAITVAFTQAMYAVKAQATIGNVNFKATTAGTSGNAYTVALTDGAVAGAEVVSITGSAVSVQIQNGVSTPDQIVAAFNGSSLVNTVLVAKTSPTGNVTPQVAPVAATPLTGGTDASGTAGNEIVTVSGTAITVQCENGVSTLAQVVAAMTASSAASALVTARYSSITNVTSPAGPDSLSGGVDGYGQPGAEKAIVSSNLIKIYLTSGVSTVAQVLTALNASTDATALATASIVGNATDVVYSPGTLQQFQGGLSRFFTFNQHELTDPTDFTEGNASVRFMDAIVQGRASFAKPVQMSDRLSLEDTSAEAGPHVPHAQRYLNRLMSLGKLTVRTSDSSPVRYYGGQLFFTSDILVEQRDSGVVGNIVSGATSPLTIADGQSVYVTLNPTTSGALVPVLANSVDKGVFVLRLCTRVGAKLFWFNGAVQSDNDVARLGAQVDYGAQVRGIITGGGTLASDQTTIGLISWSAPLFLRMFGQAGIVTITTGSVNLADGQVAYLQLDDPFVTATKVFVVDTASVDELKRADRYWVFYRSGNIVYTRNGGDLVPGEENTIGNQISADTFQFMGSLSETDNSPSYSTAGHTASATTNTYVTDGDNLTKGIKELDTATASKMTNPMTAVGDTVYGGTAGSPTRLPGNVTAAKQFLTQTGTGTTSAAPAWAPLGPTDLPYRAASVSLALNASSKSVTFSSPMASVNYRVICQLLNTTDSSVQYIPITVTEQDVNGFTAAWPGSTDTANYLLTYQAWPDA